jgi:hypothetical protein
VPDSASAACRGDRRDDGHGPVGGHGERAVDGMPPGDLDHAVDILEVDDFADIGRLEPERGAVSIDRDDAELFMLLKSYVI